MEWGKTTLFKLAILWVGNARGQRQLVNFLGLAQAQSCNCNVGWVGWELVLLGQPQSYIWLLIGTDPELGNRDDWAPCLHEDSLHLFHMVCLRATKSSKRREAWVHKTVHVSFALHLCIASLSKLCQMAKSRVIIW